MKTIIETKDLTKYYGSILGIKNLSLKINEGEIFGFIGPNGSGKSTTIRLIMNLIGKSGGKVLINGKEFSRDDVETKKTIGYLPSEVYLYDELTVKEMLDYHQKFFDKDLTKERKKLVELLQVDEKKKIEDLSLGNKKKVGIILALMHSPKILIIDEPTSGLDPIMQQTFYKLLLDEKKKGTTIFYSTHILAEVSKVCDRVGIVKEGELVAIETIDNLSKKNFTYLTIESNRIKEIEKELNLKVISEKEKLAQFRNTLKPNELLEKLSKFEIERIVIEEPTIEEIFLHFYE